MGLHHGILFSVSVFKKLFQIFQNGHPNYAFFSSSSSFFFFFFFWFSLILQKYEWLYVLHVTLKGGDVVLFQTSL